MQQHVFVLWALGQRYLYFCLRWTDHRTGQRLRMDELLTVDRIEVRTRTGMQLLLRPPLPKLRGRDSSDDIIKLSAYIKNTNLGLPKNNVEQQPRVQDRVSNMDLKKRRGEKRGKRVREGQRVPVSKRTKVAAKENYSFQIGMNWFERILSKHLTSWDLLLDAKCVREYT